MLLVLGISKREFLTYNHKLNVYINKQSMYLKIDFFVNQNYDSDDYFGRVKSFTRFAAFAESEL